MLHWWLLDLWHQGVKKRSVCNQYSAINMCLVYLHLKSKKREDKLYSTEITSHYTYCDTFRIAKEALNTLRSTGKATALGVWTLLLVMVVENSTIRHYEECWNIHFFVKDKFPGDLQSFVMPDFTFLSITITHYFSCAIRNVSRPDSCVTIKSPPATQPAAKLRQQHLQFYMIIIITQVCTRDLLKLLFRAVNSNQLLLLHSFLFKCFPTIFLLPSLVFSFSLLWCDCQDPAFSMLSSSSFSWSSFREGTYYIKVHFHKRTWCSFFIVGLTAWRCTGWFCYLTVRTGIHKILFRQ